MNSGDIFKTNFSCYIDEKVINSQRKREEKETDSNDEEIITPDNKVIFSSNVDMA